MTETVMSFESLVDGSQSIQILIIGNTLKNLFLNEQDAIRFARSLCHHLTEGPDHICMFEG